MIQQLKTFFFTIIFIILTSIQLFAWPIPDTGQTTCYNNKEKISCPTNESQDFYGQDSNYSINPPSYTKLDENGNEVTGDGGWVMVRDDVTGLIWEVKQKKDGIQDYTNPHDADNTYTWNDGVMDFTLALNMENFGGYSDWRLPTIDELKSILNYERLDPSIDTDYFSNTISDDYWSSTTGDMNSSYAWYVQFDDQGYDTYFYKSYSKYVRAVRSGQARLSDHFVINGDGTVTDTVTGLMWKQATEVDEMLWQDALKHCEDMSFAGYDDWRLPNIRELKSIVNYESFRPAIDRVYFPGTKYSSEGDIRYWSSTTDEGEVLVRGVNFEWGRDNNLNKYIPDYVRAVRSGQNRLSGHLIISSPRQASAWNVKSTMPITWDTADISGDVKISISYYGGKDGTFETISESTRNDGYYEWSIPEKVSYNCALKIEPLSDITRSSIQGLFRIVNEVEIYPLSVTVNEPEWNFNETATFNVHLTQAPDQGKNVIIELTGTNPGECSISHDQVVINGTNWQTGVDVTVTSTPDYIIDGEQDTVILTGIVISGDQTFSGLHLPNIMVKVEDDSKKIKVYSVYPAYGPANQDMDVTIKADWLNSDTQVTIYPSGGGTEISATTINYINYTVLKVTLPGQAAGEYDLKVNRSGITAIVEKAVEFYQTSDLENKKAIIVAGGGPYLDNDMWTATRKNADNAYYALCSQGYLKDAVQYLNMQGLDVTGDGEIDTDDVATRETVQDSIETWAADASLTELILYMVGPGGNWKFQFKSDQNPEYLTPADLDTWLDTLQSTAANAEIIVIYDACQSGSFLSQLSGDNRIIITGTQTNERAWFLDDGEISFSWFFWENIYSSAEIYTAFNNAKAKMVFMQTPQMDDNSGLLRRRLLRADPEIIVGRGRVISLSLPEITDISFNPAYLDGNNTTAEIIAGNVHDTNDSGMSRVWARILPPFDAFKPYDIPVLVVPTISLDGPNADNDYQSAFDAFEQTGGYKVFVHAIDKMGLIALPKHATFQQQGGEGLSPGDFNADSSVDLQDALIALQVVCGFSIPASVDLEVTGDDQVGIADALWIIQKVAGMRIE